MANAGVYQIRALHSKEVYVGSSRNLEQRKHDHFRFLRYGKHKNPKLQNSYNKHGPENFVFEVLLICDPENCLIYEQEHFERLSPEFNLVKIAGWPPSRKGKYVVHSEEAKKNMAVAAQVRGKRQRGETALRLISVCQELYESGLSIRKFCQLKAPNVSRHYLGIAYRDFLNGLKEESTELKQLDKS